MHTPVQYFLFKLLTIGQASIIISLTCLIYTNDWRFIILLFTVRYELYICVCVFYEAYIIAKFNIFSTIKELCLKGRSNLFVMNKHFN